MTAVRSSCSRSAHNGKQRLLPGSYEVDWDQGNDSCQV